MITSPRTPHFEEDWREIELFPKYSVSDTGYVRNNRTGYRLSRLPNQSGAVYVGLISDNKQNNRSVALLVAEAFLPPPTLRKHRLAFGTPINLDGDRFNNHVLNLAWRPLWYARQYHQQFIQYHRGSDAPIQDLDTGEIFETALDAAMKFGLLEKDIWLAMEANEEVWPTRRRFGLFQKTHIIPRRNRGLL